MLDKHHQSPYKAMTAFEALEYAGGTTIMVSTQGQDNAIFDLETSEELTGVFEIVGLDREPDADDDGGLIATVMVLGMERLCSITPETVVVVNINF